jgi:sec-independent protein translocase protein TatC
MSAEASSPIAAPEGEVKMTIWEHLEELRKRIIYAALGMLVTTVLGWAFRVPILAWLLRPYENAWNARHFLGAPELQTLSPAAAFVGYLQLSLVAGFVGAAPIIFYQLWAFVSPGLYHKEKRLIVPFVFFSTTLFLSGVAFAYYVAFPFSFNYFFSLLGKVSDQGTVLTQKPTLEFFLDFSTRMLLAFGGVFELPLFISFLAIAGVVTPMQLLKFGRWAILCSFIVGAVVTPGPEVSSQLAVSGALVALYFLSIGVAFVVGKRKPDSEEAGADGATKSG